jgi:catechol 2,3-dioxygenase
VGIPKVQHLEHVELRVNDLEAALDFYLNVIGLVEIERDSKTVYLGCGLDENYDLAVVQGGTGIAHFAVRISDEDEFDYYGKRLKDQGVEISLTNDAEPNQERGLRFRIPSGHDMELVLVKDNRYLEPYRPAHVSFRGFKPLDLDHVNLGAHDVKRTVEFLTNVLDFKLSDVGNPDPSDPDDWLLAWTRYGDYHHDVAFSRTELPQTGLTHHVAFAMSGIEHMKVAADSLAAAGMRLELGPGRHPVGGNLFIYFWEPGGNRFELSAEGAALDARTPTRFWAGRGDTLDAWGNMHERIPPSFFEMS